MSIKKVICVLFCFTLLLSVSACGSTGKANAVSVEETADSKIVLDYGDAESFEAALNRGENLEGKTVSFYAKEIHPDSALGYNVWSGEHLNFVSSRNPDISVGDTVTVKATTIKNLLGSWIIDYEKIDAVTGETTIVSSNQTATENTDTAVNGQKEAPNSQENTATVAPETKELPLELVDYGWFINSASSYSDDVYIDFCGIIHNPNKNLVANFPNVIVTIKGEDGGILGTGNQMGMSVMPDDTVTLVGMLSVSKNGLTEKSQIFFDIEWNDYSFINENSIVRTSDFEITNISKKQGSESRITGEVTNNSSTETDLNLSMVLRKDGKIVFLENTFIDHVTPGRTKAFEFHRYENWPEHDSIEMSAQPW